MKSSTNPYAGYRYPGELIAHAVWLYHRSCLSLWDVEDLLAERGVIVSHETIRQWCLKFGRSYARSLRRRQGRPGDTWFLDEVFVTINGERRYLSRAVRPGRRCTRYSGAKTPRQKSRDALLSEAAEGFAYVPRLIVTDKLPSYSAARKEILPSVTHWQDRWQNNRAEVSHEATRQMRRFKSVRHGAGA